MIAHRADALAVAPGAALTAEVEDALTVAIDMMMTTEDVVTGLPAGAQEEDLQGAVAVHTDVIVVEVNMNARTLAHVVIQCIVVAVKERDLKGADHIHAIEGMTNFKIYWCKIKETCWLENTIAESVDNFQTTDCLRLVCVASRLSNRTVIVCSKWEYREISDFYYRIKVLFVLYHFC